MGDTQTIASYTGQNDIHIPTKRNTNRQPRSKVYENKGDINDILRRTINSYNDERKKRNTQRVKLNQEIIVSNAQREHANTIFVRNVNKTTRGIKPKQHRSFFESFLSKFGTKFSIILQQLKQIINERNKLKKDILNHTETQRIMEKKENDEEAYRKTLIQKENQIKNSPTLVENKMTYQNELFVKILGYILNPNPDYNLTTELKNGSDAKKK